MFLFMHYSQIGLHLAFKVFFLMHEAEFKKATDYKIRVFIIVIHHEGARINLLLVVGKVLDIHQNINWEIRFLLHAFNLCDIHNMLLVL